jgi:hypothetical protein
MKRLASICALIASTAALASPVEITAEYRVSTGGIMVGSIHESFHRDGNAYTIQSVTRSEGPLKIFLDDQLTLESSGRFVSTGLQPLEFGQRRLRNSERDIKSTFDWDKGLMYTTMRGQGSETALPRETQDRLSVMYQFMNLPRYGETVTIPMATARKIEVYTYRLVEEVKLATPAGEFETRHYQRVVSDDKDTRADVWLAKERFNFPVRVVFDEPRSLRLEQDLVSLTTR